MLVDTVMTGRAASGLCCELCGGATTPIPVSYPTGRPMRSYECLSCGHEQARAVPRRPARRPGPAVLVDVA